MSRLSNNPSAHSANTMSNYYGTSFREKMKQMSKQEQIIEEKKRKIQQKLEEEMKNSASKSATESHSEAAVVTSSPQSDIFRAKIFGKRHLNLRKTTDMKKLKCEDPSSTPPPPVAPSMSASQDMFANDGSFLERFKKLQGLLPIKQSTISSTLPTPTDCVKQEPSSEETGITEPKSTAIDALHTVPYLSTLSSSDTNPSLSSANPPSFQPSPAFQSANVPPPPPVLPCLVVTTTITTAASVSSPSSLYADAPATTTTTTSSSSNSNTNSIPIIRSTPAVIPNYDNDMTTPVAIPSTHPQTIKDEDDDKYDPTSPTEDISPVKVQPDSSPRENSSELPENQNSVSQNNPENISDMLLQIRHSVKRPNRVDSSSPKENYDERVARIG